MDKQSFIKIKPESSLKKAKYQIHPAIGIARVGNSPEEILLVPETVGGLPIECESDGSTPNGDKTTNVTKDANGLIKRQAARFKIFTYDEENPNGKELKKGDIITSDVGTTGRLVDIEWTVWMANKKSSWYQFQELAGEHGYAPDHPLRNADVTDENSRQMLIIDPGPQTVSMHGKQKSASFSKGENPYYSQNFPPPLSPNSIETLGDINVIEEEDHFRLILRGGFGNSGSSKTGAQDPQIASYSNNDGWYDDVSDGPVSAKLVYCDDKDQQIRYQQVLDPAWVIVANPCYAPPIVNLVTMTDMVNDMFVRNFAYDTYLYGRADSFDEPEVIDDPKELDLWRNNRSKIFNPNYYPYFWKDIWPILIRPFHMQFVTIELGSSSAPHDISDLGDFAKNKIGVPPVLGFEEICGKKREVVKEDKFRGMRQFIYDSLRRPGEENTVYNTRANGDLDAPYCPPRCNEDGTDVAPDSQKFAQYTKALMPMLAGDNPISNNLPSKFFRLTDTQMFMLKQWANGKFINECNEDIVSCPDGTAPQTPETSLLNQDVGQQLTEGVLANVLGGSFCPGGEVGWIMRNPNIWSKPYRIRTNPLYFPNSTSGSVSDTPGLTTEFLPPALTTSGDMANGLEPGDLIKYMALPWQADFNECATQLVDVSYELWNKTYPTSQSDPAFGNEQKLMSVLWWPAHRPMQVYYQLITQDGNKTNFEYRQLDWAQGIPSTSAGDLKMVNAWQNLGFVVNNYLDPNDNGAHPYVVVVENADSPENQKYLKPLYTGLCQDVKKKSKTK